VQGADNGDMFDCEMAIAPARLLGNGFSFVRLQILGLVAYRLTIIGDGDLQGRLRG
jgi:hypothetical protein